MEKNQIVESKIVYSNSFFSILGKIFFAIIIIFVLIGAGFYFGQHSEILNNFPLFTKLIEKNTPSPAVVVPTKEINESTESAPIKKKTIIIKSEEQNYTLEALPVWKLSTEADNVNSVSTISDGLSSLIIHTNTATEGVPCGFKDAPLTPSEMFPDVSGYTYDSYTEFLGAKNRLFRRVNITANPSAGKSFFAICQKNDNTWFQPTTYGFITYEVPYSDNPEVTSAEALKTLDEMIVSLQNAN